MENLTTRISGMLKHLRADRGWSLDVASKQTGVSKAMLGQIERGESSPTIATLWKIASGFDVSFSSFVEEVLPTDDDFIHRKQDLKQMHKLDDKIKVMTVFPFDADLGFEVFIIELAPGCEHLSPAHQKGVTENIVVASGEMEVLINGNWQLLKQNEGLRFSADKPHGYRNQSTKTAIIHDVIHYESIK